MVVDVSDLALFVDVDRNAAGHASRVEDSKCLGRFLAGVTENRIIEIERLGELLIDVGWIDASGEVGDIELTQGLAVLTERLALSRSATGERFGIPGDDEGFLAFEIGQFVRLSVAPLHLKIRCRHSDFQFAICRMYHHGHAGDDRECDDKLHYL